MATRPFNFPLLLFFLLSGAGGLRAQSLDFSTTPSLCLKPNGSITVSPNGFGTGPFLYSIDLGTPVSDGSSHTFPGLVGGISHHFEVYDPTTLTTLYDDFSTGDLSPSLSARPQAASCLNNDGSLLLTASGGTGPNSYTFSVNGGPYTSQRAFTGLASGPLTPDPSVQDANGCIVSVPVIIPLNNNLQLAVNSTPPPICQGDSAFLPAGSSGNIYVWTPAVGLSDPNVLSPKAAPSKTTTYTISVKMGTSGVCPAQTADVTVTVNPAPIPDAGVDDVTCTGRSIDLAGSGAGIGGTYKWTPATFLDNPNSQYPTMVQPTVSTTYSLTVTDALGCTSLKPDAVTMTVTPPLKVIAFQDTTVFAGQPVQLFATAPAVNGPVTYEWTPSLGLNNPLIQNPTATIAVPQEVAFVARITTAAGCTGTDTVLVKAFAVADILVPTGFTPNNDGHNDVLRPITPGIKELRYFTVINRYGQQVFMTNRLGLGWDGSLNGRLVEAGTFVWMAEGVDVSGRVVQRKGTVVLIR